MSVIIKTLREFSLLSEMFMYKQLNLTTYDSSKYRVTGSVFRGSTIIPVVTNEGSNRLKLNFGIKLLVYYLEF